MNATAMKQQIQDIVVDEVFPHAPETIWKVLTTGALMSRWIRMPIEGFAPVKGTKFTYQTTPAGAWDGRIRCEVLDAVPNVRLVYAWRSGHEGNVGYGAPLDTVVTFTLTRVAEGTRVRLVHAGFAIPRNEGAYRSMSDGWQKVVHSFDDIAKEMH